MPDPDDAEATTTAARGFAVPPRLRHDTAQRRLFGTPMELPCPLCAASVPFPPKTRLVDCPSCTAPLVRGPDDRTPLAPTGVVRFAIDDAAVPELARAGIAGWVAARPAGAVLTSFERIYVPMWRFTAHVRCSWVSRDRDTTRSTVATSGEFEDDYDQQVVASTDVSHALLEFLEDASLTAAEAFTPNGLGGARILPVNVSVQDAWVKARVFFDGQAMAGNVRLDYTAIPSWSREEGALILVPAYLGREETRSISTPVLVDGVTGTVYGGIGNRPFEGPPPGPIAWTIFGSVLAVMAWGLVRILRWLVGW